MTTTPLFLVVWYQNCLMQTKMLEKRLYRQGLHFICHLVLIGFSLTLIFFLNVWKYKGEKVPLEDKTLEVQRVIWYPSWCQWQCHLGSAKGYFWECQPRCKCFWWLDFLIVIINKNLHFWNNYWILFVLHLKNKRMNLMSFRMYSMQWGLEIHSKK